MENRLVAALVQPGRRRFLASCRQVELRFGDVLCESGERIRYVYFPMDSIISLVTVLADGPRLEVGVIGSEGMLGSSIILGVNVAPQHAVVQGAGPALRMNASAFREHCQHNAALQQTLNCYVYVLMTQLAQMAACVRYHPVEMRLARWLLITRDRARAERFHLTHEFLAYMLGVRRAGVTHAARSLHRRGLIDYRRGDITILNASGLEKASCSCYRGGHRLYEQALNSSRRARPTPKARSRRSHTARAG